MDMLVDRIENPGQRRKTSLRFPGEVLAGTAAFEGRRSSQHAVRSGLADAADLRRRSSHSKVAGKTQHDTEDTEQEEHRRISLPVISVNDKPIGSSTGQNNRPPHERQISHRGSRTMNNCDYTAASTGMFSECMFEGKGQKPVSIPRPSGLVPSRSSSSSSLQTQGSFKMGHRSEQLKRMPTANADAPPQIINNLQLEATQNRNPLHHRSHKLGSRDSSAFHKRSRRSFCSTTVNDGKRLVNQFLRSMDPPLSQSVSTLDFGKPDKDLQELGDYSIATAAGYELPTSGSLQNLLYHDLESSRKKTKQQLLRSPYDFREGSSSSEVSSQSALYNTGTLLSSSGSLHSAVESVLLYGAEKSNRMRRNGSINNGIPLNYNEIDYYRRHIGSELHKFEEVLKHNLKEILMKNECDMQKNLTKFDSFTLELSRLKVRATALRDDVSNKDLVLLRKDFNKQDKTSFLRVVTTVMKTNAEQLKELEERMNTSKQKLYHQRDTLRKLEGLLTLEDSLLDSKRTSNMAYRYRYIIFDVGALAAMIGFAIFVKWLFWR